MMKSNAFFCYNFQFNVKSDVWCTCWYTYLTIVWQKSTLLHKLFNLFFLLMVLFFRSFFVYVFDITNQIQTFVVFFFLSCHLKSIAFAKKYWISLYTILPTTDYTNRCLFTTTIVFQFPRGKKIKLIECQKLSGKITEASEMNFYNWLGWLDFVSKMKT